MSHNLAVLLIIIPAFLFMAKADNNVQCDTDYNCPGGLTCDKEDNFCYKDVPCSCVFVFLCFCDEGHVCDMDTKQCELDLPCLFNLDSMCPEGFICDSDGFCYDGKCSNDNECDDGFICENDICQYKECESTSDCVAIYGPSYDYFCETDGYCQ